MREEAVAFGHRDGLKGVLTHGGGEPRDLGALILNAGIVHRVGPNRLHVKLARRLAAQGVTTLRFDLSGVGESDPRTDGMGYAERVLEEARAAMGLLEARCRLRRMAVLGICSGADNALRIARAEPRVVAAALVEGYAWETPGHHVADLVRRAVSPRTWNRLVRGHVSWRGVLARIRAVRAAVAPPPRTDDQLVNALKRPEPAEIWTALVEVAGGGKPLLLVYSREGVPYYNYRRLFRRHIRPLEGPGRVTVRILDATNHTFSPLAVQDAFCGLVEEWTLGLAGSPAAGAVGLEDGRRGYGRG